MQLNYADSVERYSSTDIMKYSYDKTVMMMINFILAH